MRGISLIVSLLVFINILNTLKASQDDELTKTILARLDELEEKLRQKDNDIEALEKKLKEKHVKAKRISQMVLQQQNGSNLLQNQCKCLQKSSSKIKYLVIFDTERVRLI